MQDSSERAQGPRSPESGTSARALYPLIAGVAFAALVAAGAAAWIDSALFRAIAAAAAAGAGVCVTWRATRATDSIDGRLNINESFPHGDNRNAMLEQLDAVGTVAQIGTWELDLKAKTAVWSDEVCRIHEVPVGHTPNLEQAINYYEPESRKAIARLVEQSIAEGVHFDQEFTIIAAGGTRKHVRAIGIPVMEGGACVKLWGAFQDVTELRRAREQLESLQRRFVSSIEASAAGPWDYEPATGAVWYSDQFKQLIGLSPQEADSFEPVIDSFVARLHPEDVEPTLHAVDAHVHENAPYEVQYRLDTGSGNYRWFQARGQSIRDEHGTVVRMSGSISDIHEQYTAESRLNLAARAAQLGLWDWDITNDAFFFDETYHRMLGYAPGELDTSDWSCRKICHPDDIDGERALLIAHLEGATPTYISEHRVQRKDGSWLWVRDEGEVVERNADGSPKRMLGVHIDIDDSKRLNLALQSITELNIAGPIEQTMTAIARTLADLLGAMFVGVSRVREDDSGTQIANLIGGWHVSRPADPLQYDLAGTPCAEALREDYCAYLDRIAEHFPDDEPLAALGARAYHGLRLRDRNGNTLGVVFVLHDRPVHSGLDVKPTLRLFGARISAELERSDAEAAIRSAMEHARLANEAKSEFLANMSHEIRTPITAILGYGGLLEEEARAEGGSTRARDASAVLLSNAKHLLSLINDTLDVSKIEAGKMTTEQIPTDPGAVITQTVEAIRERARAHEIDLRVFGVETLPPLIRTDPTKLRQILMNLVGNAVKFTEVGFVEIRASHKPSDSTLCIEIQDSGIGMTPEQIERVLRFEPFTQADYSTTRQFGGTGLGLKISSELAGMLGGEISATSSPGKGSTFTLTIATGEAASMDESPPIEDSTNPHARDTSTPMLTGVRLLLAEDSIDNQRLIQFHLERRGAEVTSVHDGLEAVRVALEGESTFDVILMDMQMPELDGYGAARRIRERGLDLPIIALTAHALADEEQKCLNAGCSAYLSKPIDWDRLASLARSLVDANREPDAGSAAA